MTDDKKTTIDIYSKGKYPANVLSNFYANNFVFDGVGCASMEGFLQSLKYRNKKRQIKICELSGKRAKRAGKRKIIWKITGNLYWQGKRYKRESPEFDNLRLSAYEALFSNQKFRDALLSTNENVLIHTLGSHDKRKTILTEEEFIEYLNILRNNGQKGKDKS